MKNYAKLWCTLWWIRPKMKFSGVRCNFAKISSHPVPADNPCWIFSLLSWCVKEPSVDVLCKVIFWFTKSGNHTNFENWTSPWCKILRCPPATHSERWHLGWIWFPSVNWVSWSPLDVVGQHYNMVGDVYRYTYRRIRVYLLVHLAATASIDSQQQLWTWLYR